VGILQISNKKIRVYEISGDTRGCFCVRERIIFFVIFIAIVSTHPKFIFIGVANSMVEYSAFKCG